MDAVEQSLIEGLNNADVTASGFGQEAAGIVIIGGIRVKAGSGGGPGAGKAFSESTKDAARAESNDTCVFCGRKTTREPGPSQSQIDHSIPKYRNGNNSLDNAQNTCRSCNLDKRAQTSQEYINGK